MWHLYSWKPRGPWDPWIGSRDIVELHKLKLLNLNYSIFKRNNYFKVIEWCSSLEELYFVGSFFIHSSIMHQNVMLPKLKRFRIVDHHFPKLKVDFFFLKDIQASSAKKQNFPIIWTLGRMDKSHTWDYFAQMLTHSSWAYIDRYFATLVSYWH